MSGNILNNNPNYSMMGKAAMMMGGGDMMKKVIPFIPIVISLLLLLIFDNVKIIPWIALAGFVLAAMKSFYEGIEWNVQNSVILCGIVVLSIGIIDGTFSEKKERYVEKAGCKKLSKKEKFNKLKEFYIERADTPAAEADDDTKALQAGLQSLIADVEEQAKGYQSQITALATQFNLSEEALRTKVAELQAQQEQTGAARNQYEKEVEWTKLLNDAAKQLQEANSGLVDTAQQQAAALQAVATAAGEGLQKTVNYEAPSVAASTFFSGLERPERYSQTADGV